MAEKLRVHTLSKELGVTSKAIVEKCVLEGVDGITNHMSTVSAGLAETIREWFSGASHGTAVEEAPPVDLQKVKAKSRSRRPKKSDAEEGGIETEEPPIPQETPEEKPEETEPVVPVIETAPPPQEVPAEPVVVPEPVAPVAVAPPAVSEAPAKPVVAQDKEHKEHKEHKAPKEHKEKPPEKIAPAGPQNVPAPAQMKGPRIVGYAKPDVVERPVPRARFAPSTGPVESSEAAGFARKPGKGVKNKIEEDSRILRARANPRRSRESLAEVGERLKEWNERDLLERQERAERGDGSRHSCPTGQRKGGGGVTRTRRAAQDESSGHRADRPARVMLGDGDRLESDLPEAQTRAGHARHPQQHHSHGHRDGHDAGFRR